jgi:hypothetical protein
MDNEDNNTLNDLESNGDINEHIFQNNDLDNTNNSELFTLGNNEPSTIQYHHNKENNIQTKNKAKTMKNKSKTKNIKKSDIDKDNNILNSYEFEEINKNNEKMNIMKKEINNIQNKLKNIKIKLEEQDISIKEHQNIFSKKYSTNYNYYNPNKKNNIKRKNNSRKESPKIFSKKNIN